MADAAFWQKIRSDFESLRNPDHPTEALLSEGFWRVPHTGEFYSRFETLAMRAGFGYSGKTGEAALCVWLDLLRARVPHRWSDIDSVAGDAVDHGGRITDLRAASLELCEKLETDAMLGEVGPIHPPADGHKEEFVAAHGYIPASLRCRLPPGDGIGIDTVDPVDSWLVSTSASGTVIETRSAAEVSAPTFSPSPATEPPHSNQAFPKRRNHQSTKKATALAENINRCREECDWSYEDLAQAVGCHKTTVLRHVNHGVRPKAGMIQEYASAFTEKLGRAVSVADLQRGQRD